MTVLLKKDKECTLDEILEKNELKKAIGNGRIQGAFLNGILVLLVIFFIFNLGGVVYLLYCYYYDIPIDNKFENSIIISLTFLLQYIKPALEKIGITKSDS